MQSVTIGQISTVSSLTASDYIEVEQSGASKKATLSALAAIIPTPAADQIRGYIDGLICSNAADTDHDISIAAGVAADSTNGYWLELSSALVKQIDAAWSAGNNAGGLFSGSVAANTNYSLFIIKKDSDGTIDAGWDVSAVAANRPAGYSVFRRIRRYITDASSNLIPTDQYGDFVRIRNPIVNRSMAVLTNTSRNAYSVTAPPGLVARVMPSIRWGSTSASHYFWIDSAQRTDAAASSTNHTIRITLQYDIKSMILDLATDSSSQVYACGDSTTLEFELVSLGWIDDRGKDA